jgi:hypothetical protein
MTMEEATFKHSGDLGDIVFALPTMRALGGGILYLDPRGGEGALASLPMPASGKTKLTERTIESIKAFLLFQPCVHDVRIWYGEAVRYDLDQFRRYIRFNNLAYSHLEAFGLSHQQVDDPWLTVPKPDKPVLPSGKKVVVSRSVRYQGNHGFWEYNAERFKKEAVFIGYPFEHELWEYTFGKGIEYLETPSVINLAQAIQECALFVSNQGLPHAIAEGMKKKLFCEVDKTYPAAVFKRQGATYV